MLLPLSSSFPSRLSQSGYQSCLLFSTDDIPGIPDEVPPGPPLSVGPPDIVRLRAPAALKTLDRPGPADTLLRCGRISEKPSQESLAARNPSAPDVTPHGSLDTLGNLPYTPKPCGGGRSAHGEGVFPLAGSHANLATNLHRIRLLPENGSTRRRAHVGYRDRPHL